MGVAGLRSSRPQSQRKTAFEGKKWSPFPPPRWETFTPPLTPGADEDPQQRRVRELENKVSELQGIIGQKTLELDFFAGALRRIKETRQKRSSSGEMASTPKSAGGCNRKAD